VCVCVCARANYAEWSSIFVPFLNNSVHIYNVGVVLYVRQMYVRNSG